MRKYDAVLFDLDGTVLDTSVGILKSIRETINEFNLKELSEDELKTFIGPPVEWSFNDKYGLEGDELKAVVMCFRDRYSNHNLLDAKINNVSLLKLALVIGAVHIIAVLIESEFTQKLGRIVLLLVCGDGCSYSFFLKIINKLGNCYLR